MAGLNKRVLNLPVGLFSSARLLLLPDSDRWSCDTKMQLDEEPSPHWWSGAQRQRKRERGSMTQQHLTSPGSQAPLMLRRPTAFYLLFYVYSLLNLVHLLACPAHIETPGPSGTTSKRVLQSQNKVYSFTKFSQRHHVT